ncbi:hypothetical protein [Winogradskyella bathintestinalis]|uniref:Uncharacterized protein n=1 Tax=Winogradskyella bathintestinalis TaxID=3035208 RepID=A0ABT7ZU77_9FLAO|nr:hypothetical protein [Winogradskyella bathintestinalis]MDN3492557.1 hypothetical protein [Winogradskyella bathintestinalis]
MSSKSNDSKDKAREIPDSSTKKSRESKSVHSPLDNSQEDGWKPKANSEEE